MQRRFGQSVAGVVAVLGLALALPAAATLIDFAATIDGAQANAGAGTGSPATGSATMTLDDATNLFSWNITWSGLSAPITVAHFHGPAAPDANAGVQLNFAAISGLVSPSIGAAVITDPQAADLLAGLWYINIHTENFPGGEIRGQVLRVPEPTVMALLLSGLAGLLYARRRRRV